MTPGWYGKLPGMGDFAHRRMPDAFRIAWDRWLQDGFALMRVRHPSWTDHYLKAPLWCFVIGDGVIGAKCWIGVLMPSVDGVGRYFPITVASELLMPPSELQGEALAHVRQWWSLAMKAALEGLEFDLDAERFDARLQALFASDEAATQEGDSPALALPVIGQTLWFTDLAGKSGLGMTSQGLPQHEQFEALFGIVPNGTGHGTKAS